MSADGARPPYGLGAHGHLHGGTEGLGPGDVFTDDEEDDEDDDEQVLIDFNSAVSLSSQSFASTLDEAELEAELALIKQLRETLLTHRIGAPPRLAERKEKVWGKDWWTVEVTVVLGTEGPVWFTHDDKQESRVVAGSMALNKAITTAETQTRPTVAALAADGRIDSPHAHGFGSGRTMVKLTNVTIKGQKILTRLRAACAKAGITGAAQLSTCTPTSSAGNKVMMEVSCGDHVLANAANKRWADASEAALQMALDRMDKMLKYVESFVVYTSGLLSLPLKE